MIISITGTPGTGKDTISKIIAEKIGLQLIDLNKLAEEKKLFVGHDKKRGCEIVDLRKLSLEIKKLKKDSIIQSHYSHELDSDLVVVLRTNPGELRKRLEKRGWAKEKIEENIEAEIMEVCKSDALEKNKKVFEVDTSSRGPEESAEDAVNIIFREAFGIKRGLKLPDKLLEYFKKPYGRIFNSAESFVSSGIWKKIGLLIVVGDQSSYTVLKAGLEPDIIIVDGKVRRKAFEEKIDFAGEKIKVSNSAGVTTQILWNTIKKAILESKEHKTKIEVVGEDDLGVLPSVIMAPLGSVVLYGQPELVFKGEEIHEGIVGIEVDLKKKKGALMLLKEMDELNI